MNFIPDTMMYSDKKSIHMKTNADQISQNIIIFEHKREKQNVYNKYYQKNELNAYIERNCYHLF